jgi:NO-binding membrane sensor protein with MHYT domain
MKLGEKSMTPEFTALYMSITFLLGVVMVVGGGLGFMRSNLVLMQTRSRLAQGVVFAAAGLMFVAGIGVHFTGSSNTAFLKGQMQRASQCELEGESAHPDARGGRTGVIGRHIVACMNAAGFRWTGTQARCQDAPIATNGYCYEPAAWFDRAVVTAQLAFE